MNGIFLIAPVSYTHLDVYKRPGFVLEATAAEMVATGRFQIVADVEPITQPVYAAMHQRHRPQRAYRPVSYTHLDVYKRQP